MGQPLQPRRTGGFAKPLPKKERRLLLSYRGNAERAYALKSFADPALFRVISALVAEAGSDLSRATWQHRGKTWTKERHTFSSTACGFALDVYRIEHAQADAWTLLVVHEHWWDSRGATIRSSHWAKHLAGSRTKALGWLRDESQRLAGIFIAARQ